jgi:hypothetical protein
MRERIVQSTARHPEILMKRHSMRGSLKHLGTLHGEGRLSLGDSEQSLGAISYEIDGFLRGAQRSDSGQIEGRAEILAKAFRAGTACIALADGHVIDVVVADPRGGATAEIIVSGRFPQFGDTA